MPMTTSVVTVGVRLIAVPLAPCCVEPSCPAVAPVKTIQRAEYAVTVAPKLKVTVSVVA